MILRGAIVILVCLGASAQPVWTDLMSHTGYTTGASGVYWEFSSQDTNGYNGVAQTNIATYPNHGVPRDHMGNPVSSGGNDPVCTSQPPHWNTPPPYYRYPQQRLETYAASGIKGVGFLGTFGSGSVGTFYSGSELWEGVFFHEVACYSGGREYGFFYSGFDTNVYAYWEVNANCGSSNCNTGTDSDCSSCTSGLDSQHHESLGSWTNTNYYFEIYPTGDNSSCGFQVLILDTSYNIQYSHLFAVGTDITKIDPDFCANVTSSGGESGHVTTATVYSPTISSIDTANELSLSRVIVGK